MSIATQLPSIPYFRSNIGQVSQESSMISFYLSLQILKAHSSPFSPDALS